MAGRVVEVARKERPAVVDTPSLWAIAVGLAVTGRHFLTNLWGFVIRRPRIFTVQFPEERIDLPPAFRGMPVLVQMENGKERCVACGLCEWACPTDCITIVPAETEDEVERYPMVFDIDMLRCMFCGLCEEACPEEAIVMSQRIEVASYDRPGSLWHKEDLLVPAEKLGKRFGFIRSDYGR